MQFQFKTPKTQITEDTITSDFHYETTHVEQTKDGFVATPISKDYKFKLNKKAPKLGLMMIGWGGNNGTTVTASILANKHNLKWNTRTGEHEPNYYGSYTQSATMRIGATSDVLPFVNPNDVVIGGWDISKTNIADALKRAKVVEYDLQRQLYPLTQDMVPLPSVYYKSYIAANQDDRADNVLTGTKQENLNTLRQNIKDFKKTNQLDKVVVLWTATTERYVDIREGEEEVSPSTLFAVAAILEDFPGVIELANQHNGAVMGDDFKTGQTKIKSVLSDFLVSSGLKLQSIVSYNHLGNNDGKNLSSPSQFRSKEISKSNVVDDVVESNSIMYKEGEHPDHSMDEYTSEIILGGHNTIAIHNTCEDSLLAAPLIIDLCILMEFMTRVTYSVDNLEFSSFNAVVSMISYLLKAPVVPKGAPVINALFKQRECLDNFFRALLGLPVDNHLLLEGKTKPFF
ncbi:Inositol-3-phosphate synthase [Entamoeba marina]